MSKPEWVESVVNMASTTNREAVVKHLASCLSYYKATDADCVMFNESDAYAWQKPILFHYTLRLKTYKGWKVYMLMTGCLASKPAYEDDQPADLPAETYIPDLDDDWN